MGEVFTSHHCDISQRKQLEVLKLKHGLPRSRNGLLSRLKHREQNTYILHLIVTNNPFYHYSLLSDSNTSADSVLCFDGYCIYRSFLFLFPLCQISSKIHPRQRKFGKLFTYHTIFKCSEVTLLPRVSEEFDISVCLAQYVSWMAGVSHLLDGSATVQPQKTHLHHISTWIVKLMRNEQNIMQY